jgi:hypothetical protein
MYVHDDGCMRAGHVVTRSTATLSMYAHVWLTATTVAVIHLTGGSCLRRTLTCLHSGSLETSVGQELAFALFAKRLNEMRYRNASIGRTNTEGMEIP